MCVLELLVVCVCVYVGLILPPLVLFSLTYKNFEYHKHQMKKYDEPTSLALACGMRMSLCFLFSSLFPSLPTAACRRRRQQRARQREREKRKRRGSTMNVMKTMPATTGSAHQCSGKGKSTARIRCISRAARVTSSLAFAPKQRCKNKGVRVHCSSISWLNVARSR